MKTIPNRPAISNILIKASANHHFRSKLLTNPADALGSFNLPPEDVEVLTTVKAASLPEYAREIGLKLMAI